MVSESCSEVGSKMCETYFDGLVVRVPKRGKGVPIEKGSPWMGRHPKCGADTIIGPKIRYGFNTNRWWLHFEIVGSLPSLA